MSTRVKDHRTAEDLLWNAILELNALIIRLQELNPDIYYRMTHDTPLTTLTLTISLKKEPHV